MVRRSESSGGGDRPVSPELRAPWPASRSPSIESEIEAELERLRSSESAEASLPASRASGSPRTALIVCGALAREVLALRDRHGWEAEVLGVPALLHNRPDRIPPAVGSRIRQARALYDRVLVVYGDCGTGGMLDRLLEAEGVERLRGPHCYEFYADRAFDELMAEAPGTFFLTDYMVRSFDHLVVEGLGLDRFPELRDDYFRNYTRVVYLSQTEDPELHEHARLAAERLSLPLTTLHVGYGALESRLLNWFGR